ncbi:hypothetical protein PFFCH_01342 [Plasmodium falciparum FCH/4]|uniref:Uncharacterized protein n=1 Tax=Plasmodium falciparum FCH/4 TaxID=1036724 RepID=A0A024VRZ0_PLAFA|nr:hypothetical protein PFFCH_01342 [Plasmodium falciparum FCH/4]
MVMLPIFFFKIYNLFLVLFI